MELWIRSQDKTDLSKINRLKIREHVIENGEKEYFILNNNSMSDVVGIYKTKRRALEVLDEIQKLLITYYQSIDYQIVPIYEMPKE